MYQRKSKEAKMRRLLGRLFRNSRMATITVSVVLLLALTIGGTIAWLSTKAGPLVNPFTPSKVTCEVTEEDFNDETGIKTNVNVKNTGDTEAYIRVKLVTYRTNDAGQHIGGTAALPTFTPGENWVAYGGFYYYTQPVAAGASPASALISSITLVSSYDDADGGRQAIDIVAEAIQSKPATAVGEAWGVSITPGIVSDYD